MTADLPKLNIPCGSKLKGSKEDDVIRCGDLDFQGTLNDVPRKRLYCKNCDYQLFVLKAHAADYHSLLNVTPVGIARIQVEAARDAVLKLTDEIKLKDLEVWKQEEIKMKKVVSIEFLKGRLGGELGRLQERYRASTNRSEIICLQGSIFTVQKIMGWMK